MLDYIVHGNPGEKYRVISAIVNPELFDGRSSLYIRPEYKREGESNADYNQIADSTLSSLTARDRLLSDDPLVKEVRVNSDMILKGEPFMSEKFAVEAVQRGATFVSDRNVLVSRWTYLDPQVDRMNDERRRLRSQTSSEDHETRDSALQRLLQLNSQEEIIDARGAIHNRLAAGLCYSTAIFRALCKGYCADVEEKEESMVEDIMNTMVSEAVSHPLSRDDMEILEHWAAMYKVKARARRAKAQADLTKILNKIAIEQETYYGPVDDTILEAYQKRMEEAEQNASSLHAEDASTGDAYHKRFHNRFGSHIESPVNPAGWNKLWSSLYDTGGDPVLPASEDQSEPMVRSQSIRSENVIRTMVHDVLGQSLVDQQK